MLSPCSTHLTNILSQTFWRYMLAEDQAFCFQTTLPTYHMLFLSFLHPLLQYIGMKTVYCNNQLINNARDAI